MKFLLRNHMTFYIAAAGGVLTLLVSWIFIRSLAPVLAANCFFILYLLMSLYLLPHMTVENLKKHAGNIDEPVWIIFLVTFVAVIVAIVSLFILINREGQPDQFDLIITLASVPLGWLTIHMLTAMHYARIYWQKTSHNSHNGKQNSGQISGQNSGNTPANNSENYRGGLQFPGTPEPVGSDFVYYSYVIGMTAQTSDTNVTTSAMRRTTLRHSIVSFFFNTVLVAAAVNVVVAL